LVVVPRKLRSKDKIITERRNLAAILRGLMAQGKTVVLTNGVFDLLHVGHARCLEDARSRGDFLVVAVNTDAGAERLKGKGHPVVPLEERMEMLSALWCVDYVTPLQEDTADAVIELLRPNVYAKGTEYTLKTLPERDTVKKFEVKAVFAGDKKSHSTSKLLQKIKKRKLD
jgi:D-glycero-beta-D-manno-heptose 1-phosphate adenylyltransferase